TAGALRPGNREQRLPGRSAPRADMPPPMPAARGPTPAAVPPLPSAAKRSPYVPPRPTPHLSLPDPPADRQQAPLRLPAELAAPSRHLAGPGLAGGDPPPPLPPSPSPP